VQDGLVNGWDDPRMPTLSGMRRRGFPPQAIQAFCARIGVAKAASTIDVGVLEEAVRDHLNKTAPRAMAVLRPLRLVLVNYPEDSAEEFVVPVNPEDASAGTRSLPFTRTLWIERDDFMESPPKQFFRLAPGREVRLRGAYLVTCTEVVKDASGEVVELRCTYDPATRGGDAPDGRKVKSTLHWVSAAHAVDAEVRVYDRLFTRADPDDAPPGSDWLANLNPQALHVLHGCKLEPRLARAAVGASYQFERTGYFCVDRDSAPGRLVFNRTVSLRDTWAKVQEKMAAAR
jgi:glutaminyl-tRNA synthetase